MVDHKELLNKAKQIWQLVGINQKITIGSMAFVLVAFMVFSASKAGKPSFSLLYSKLTGEDAAEVVQYLKDEQIEYQLKAGGSAIYVPNKNVYEVRMQMAKKGVIKGSGVGFEIFDETNIGMTDFVQKINYVRALEGELSRTISAMDGVESARVHIVMPEEKLFEENQQDPTASVVLELRSAGIFDMGQIAGIKNLIASSVEGLKAKAITIVDTQGTMLSRALGSDDISAELSSVQLGQKKNVEKYLTEKAQTLLDGVLGASNAMVRIDVSLNFNQEERTEEIYDPEKAVVRSEMITSEKSSGFTGPPSGVPGVPTNTGKPEENSSGKTAKKSDKAKEVIKSSYEIDKVVKHVVATVGDIKRMSVAVFIKQRYEVKDGKKTPVVRSEEELKVYEDIVKNALGYSKKRGDEVVVREMPFNEDAALAREASLRAQRRSNMINQIMGHAVKAITILAFPVVFFIVAKMVFRKPEKKGKAGMTAKQQSVAEIQEREKKAQIVKDKDFEKKVVSVSEENPEEIAQLLVGWINSENENN